MLYKLLTGHSPHQFEEHNPEGIATAIAAREAILPSKWAAELKGDLDFILLKALRKDPRERYATVEQFAEDLRAFLESRTVRARSGNAWYRTRKFVRRYWLPVAAAALVIVSLAAGLYIANRQRLIANRERAIAERRFEQVRQLANKVLALDDVVRPLPGSTKARSEIVAMSQQYLAGLSSQTGADPNLAFEAAQAYFALARVQGLPTAGSLGQLAQAEASLAQADALLGKILGNPPLSRKALLLAAEVSVNRMILANTGHRHEETLIEARKAAARLDSALGMGPASPAEIGTGVRVFSDIALAYKNEHRYDDAARYARRAIALARSSPSPNVRTSMVLSVLADALRFSGDLEGAYQAIRQARSAIALETFPGDAARRQDLFGVLWREGTILGQDGSISLERSAEAAQVLQQAFDLADEWAREDSYETHSRILLGQAARELGPLLAHSDPQRALAVYDKAVLRLREVNGNNGARREEARLLAYSSDVLRRLRRAREARERIDAAFRLLRDTKDYPSDRIDTGNEAYAVLGAWAEYLAGTGEPQRAAGIYRELLDKITANESGPRNDLPGAAQLSSIYGALAALDRRLGRSGDAEGLDARRLDLWRSWDRKLPHNPFVLRQIAAAQAP